MIRKACLREASECAIREIRVWIFGWLMWTERLELFFIQVHVVLLEKSCTYLILDVLNTILLITLKNRISRPRAATSSIDIKQAKLLVR